MPSLHLLLLLSKTPFRRVASCHPTIVGSNHRGGQLPHGQVLHEGVIELVIVLLVPVDREIGSGSHRSCYHGGPGRVGIAIISFHLLLLSS